MARQKKNKGDDNGSAANLGFEAKLWAAADALRNNMAGGNMGCDALLAWPTADVSFMAPAVVVNVVYGRKLAREALMNDVHTRHGAASEASVGAGAGADPAKGAMTKSADVSGPRTAEQAAAEIARANSTFPAAGLNYIDKVIDPRDTRIELMCVLERARGVDGRSGRSERKLANWPRMA